MQIIYERNARPSEKWHEPWVQRVTGQMLAAFGELESRLKLHPLAVTSATIGQAGVSTAVAWNFSQTMFPDVLIDASFPTLADFSHQAESLVEFAAAPHGATTYLQR